MGFLCIVNVLFANLALYEYIVYICVRHILGSLR